MIQSSIIELLVLVVLTFFLLLLFVLLDCNNNCGCGAALMRCMTDANFVTSTKCPANLHLEVDLCITMRSCTLNGTISQTIVCFILAIFLLWASVETNFLLVRTRIGIIRCKKDTKVCA